MEKICDTPLIEFDIYNVFEISVLRKKIREMEEKAAAKILDMYKEIITYIIIVYEGFEAHITQVSYWYIYSLLELLQNLSILNFFTCSNNIKTQIVLISKMCTSYKKK